MELLLFVKTHEFHRLGAETLVDLGLRVKMLKTVHGRPPTAFRAALVFWPLEPLCGLSWALPGAR